ncbi:MAG TPA: efflux RND transporter permease subunit [Sporomusa sp.]|nr:efflux RND transporter permease subunit [Sporomusa sp.]HWR08703.1 efflux RND transporter permease subunit [Sporomusa sp.]
MSVKLDLQVADLDIDAVEKQLKRLYADRQSDRRSGEVVENFTIAGWNVWRLRYAGFSINTLNLFAMVLAIGLVVDDAIINSN